MIITEHVSSRKRTNILPNPGIQGATIGVIGGSGVAPRDWLLLGRATTVDIEALSSYNNNNLIQIRFAGTPNSTGNMEVVFSGTQDVPALDGWDMRMDLGVRLVAGDFTNVGNIRLAWSYRTSDGGFSSLAQGTPFQNDIDGTYKTFTEDFTVSNPNAAFVRMTLAMGVTSGSAVNFTLQLWDARLGRV